MADKFPWMRVLYIIFSNDNGEKFVVGQTEDSFAIKVSIHKYMSALKDNAEITIYNLSYSQLAYMIKNELYNVDIYAGYKNMNNTTLVFKGGITYIENTKSNNNTLVGRITCASGLMATKAYQKRLGLQFNSGMNMFTVLESISGAYGVKNAKIDEELKNEVLDITTSGEHNLAEWLNEFLGSTKDFYGMSVDAASGSIFDIIAAKSYEDAKANVKQVSISTRDINLDTMPTITSEGLTLFVAPIYNISPGNTIKLLNDAQALIQILGGSPTDNFGYYISQDGTYVVYELIYELGNRSSDFNLQILGKARNKFVDALVTYAKRS